MNGDAHPSDDGLTPVELDALRQAMGRSGAPRVAHTIDEVERQTALEDLVIVLIDSAASAAREFLDTLLQVVTHDPSLEGDADDDGGGAR